MHQRRTLLPLTAVVIIGVTTLIAGAQKAADDPWNVPAGASQELNPVKDTPTVIEKGRKIFESKCQRCHGKDGRGRGPEADPEHPAGNFTDRLRVAFNPDGVMFYKIWNGRESPKMPSFRKEGLSKEDVWTVIHFVKTFRK